MIIESISLLGALGALSIEDVRRKKISFIVIIAAGIMGLLLHLCFLRLTIWDILGGIAVGAVLYFISVLSDEAVGKGDAMLIAITGIYLGFKGNIVLLWVASVLIGIYGMGAVLLRKLKRGSEIPFVPFVLVGYVVCLFMWEGHLL